MKRVIYASRKLTARDFQKFLRSTEAPRSIKTVAADLLQQWYNNEHAFIEDITYDDVLDMADTADDQLDRAMVFYAVGYHSADDFREALEDLDFSKDEIDRMMRGK